jgi:glycosyltransferase involved in cell wall biosynthesis
MNKNFTIIFTRLKNVDLVKMPGMTSFYISKLTDKNVKCTIVTLNNDDYIYHNEFSDYFDLVILDKEKKYKSPYKPIYKYLRENALKIDILNLYHLDNESLLYAFLYKFFNKNGKLLLELDADERIKDFFEPANRSGFLKITNKIRPFKKIILKGLVKKSDFIAVETESIYKYLLNTKIKTLKKKLFLNPYGINEEELRKYENSNIKKEKIILSIGRIGSFQKNNEMLMDALKKIKGFKGWKFYFIGPIEKTFEEYINNFYNENPILKENVKFIGEISDRKVLSEYIQSAKIFCLTSRYESWGIVLTEAAFYNCFIISTDVGCAKEILDNMVEGKIVNNSEELLNIIESIVNDELNIKETQKPTKDEYIKKTSWENTVNMLLKKIKLN